MIQIDDILSIGEGQATHHTQEQHRYIKLDQHEQDKEELSKILLMYADRNLKSEEIRAFININIKALDTKTLLIKAIECISLMTGDKVFYNQNIKHLEELGNWWRIY